MDFSPADRAKIVAQYLANKEGITQAQLGKKMGYSNRSAFSAVLNGLKTMPASFCERLAAIDPEINPDFLEGKTDVMLRKDQGQPSTSGIFNPAGHASKKGEGVYVPAEFVQMITNLSNIIQGQQQTIQSQQETIRAALGATPVEKGRIG